MNISHTSCPQFINSCIVTGVVTAPQKYYELVLKLECCLSLKSNEWILDVQQLTCIYGHLMYLVVICPWIMTFFSGNKCYFSICFMITVFEKKIIKSVPATCWSPFQPSQFTTVNTRLNYSHRLRAICRLVNFLLGWCCADVLTTAEIFRDHPNRNRCYVRLCHVQTFSHIALCPSIAISYWVLKTSCSSVPNLKVFLSLAVWMLK